MPRYGLVEKLQQKRLQRSCMETSILSDEAKHATGRIQVEEGNLPVQDLSSLELLADQFITLRAVAEPEPSTLKSSRTRLCHKEALLPAWRTMICRTAETPHAVHATSLNCVSGLPPRAYL
ncbi:MAG: hypothetical protein RJP95_03805 [Pirellulales bacterium]